MNKARLYRPFEILRRLNEREALVYRCLELLPDGGFVVQSMDRIWLPFDTEITKQHERQFWELFCEVAPEERFEPRPSVEEAIMEFNKYFSIE
jgi:hypothetical protein